MNPIFKYLFSSFLFLCLIGYSQESKAQCGTDTLRLASGTFDDGSGAGNYSSNTSCTWLIQPTNNPLTITLTMNSVNLSIFNDRVRVYDGTDNTGTLLATFTFNNTGSPVTAFSGSMFVEFTTDGFANAAGWSASYTTATAYCQLNTNLSANSGTFSDGSPDGGNYFDSTDCSWLIQPTMTNMAVRLIFNRFDTESIHDSLTIYDGATTSDPILGSYSGSTVPAGITSSGSNMLLTFKTDSANAANGWEVSYQTQPIPACNGQTTFTTATGTFDDGSGNGSNYVQNSNCSWLISPPGAVSIDLSFNYFTTQNNDIVRVYDGTSSSGTLLGTYSGNNVPSTVTATSGNMYVEFTTDFRFNANGWEASYTSSNVVTLDANPDTIYLNAGGGSNVSFNLTANTSWTVTENTAWMIPAPAFGSGNGSVNIIAIQANIGPDRDAPVFINSATSSNSDTVIVVQTGSGRFISASPDTLYFDALSAPSQPINLMTNVNWNANTSDSWISFNPPSGSNNGSVNVSVQNHTGGQIRNGMIVFSGNLGASDDTVYIVQDTIPPSLSVNPRNIILGQAVGSTSSFTINSTVDWQTQVSANWLSISTPPMTSDTATIQVTADSMNLSTTTRSAYIAVNDVFNTLFDTVFVTQQGGALVLEAVPNSVSLNASAGSSASSVVNSNVMWTATPAANWISINPASGNDTTNVTISANSDNTDIQNRSSFITLEGNMGSLLDTIFIDQIGTLPILSVNPSTLNFPYSAPAIDSFRVFSNTKWNISGGVSWLSVVAPVTSDTATVLINLLSGNITQSPRSATIIIQDTSGNLIDSVVVTQAGLIGSITATPDAITLGFANGSTDSVAIVADVNWTIAHGANWLQVSPSSGTNNGLVILTATSANNSGTSRTAILSVDGVGALSDTITVTQIDGTNPSFEVSKDTVYVDSAQSSTGTFSVLSNVSNWTLSENSSWLLVNPTSGSGTSLVTVLAVTQNVFGAPRYATITASSQGFNDRTVVVAQRGVATVFQLSKTQLLIGSDSNATVDFEINSNVPSWSVSENSSWMEVSPTNGAFIQMVTVRATADNNSGAQRTDTLTISSPPLVPRIIQVTQDTVMAIGIDEAAFDKQLTIYPNPTNGLLRIEIGNEFVGNTLEASVFNMLGEELPIRLDFSTRNQAVIQLDNYPNGIYLINFRYKEKFFSRKIALSR